MKVQISITGIQSAGGENDTIQTAAVGEWEPIDDGWLLRYEENEDAGMAGVTTELRITETMVVLERSGALCSRLVLEKGKRHLCQYETGYGPLILGIDTQDIDQRLGEDGGELRLSYTMDTGQGEPLRHRLYLTVQRT
ncbi:MAG: DUF1934 domain-containing protein [Clostridiales bacterium]|nr:DUF1934 domain-containing protein [Clostridiales bacterium]